MTRGLTIAILLFLCVTSFAQYSQDYFITNALQGSGSKDFDLLQYGRKDYGFGILNAKGAMEWQVALPGYPVGMGKFHNDVLVFYSPKEEDFDNTYAEIHAMLIDPAADKLISDKVVYKNDTKYQVEQFILNDPSGNFQCILLRGTPLKKGLQSLSTRADTKMEATTQLNALTLDASLQAHTSDDIKSVALQAIFMEAVAGNDNDFYICSVNGDQLIVEQLGVDGSTQARLVTPAPIKNKSKFFPLLQYDTVTLHCIDISIAYKNDHKDDVIRSFRFNFNNQKVYATDEDVLDKDYARALTKADGKIKTNDLKPISELYPVQIIETGDKVIVIKEIQWTYTPSNSNAERADRGGSVISVYAKNDLQLERNIIIAKNYETFIYSLPGIWGHVRDGRLYAITCELSGVGKYKTYLYTINPDDGSVDKKALEKEDAGKGWITDPTTVAWFNKNMIVPYTEAKAALRLKFKTDLQNESY